MGEAAFISEGGIAGSVVTHDIDMGLLSVCLSV